MRPNRNILLLSFGFFFISLGFSGVQQYVTVFFSKQEQMQVGFISLILIYAVFTLAGPLGAVSVAKFGAKKSMMLASLFYGLFALSLLVKMVWVVYLASILLGIAAALLWNGQNVYIIRAGSKDTHGKNAGFFSMATSLSAVLSITAVWLFLKKYSFSSTFLFFSMMPFLAFFLLSLLKDIRVQEVKNSWTMVRKALTSQTALRFSTLWFAYSFIYGLVMGFLPLEITQFFGLAYVGPLSAAFYVIPLLFSYSLGRLSDLKGRKTLIVISFLLSLGGLVFLSLPFGNALGKVFLLLGLLCLTLYYALGRVVNIALLGDVSSLQNLDYLTSLFWTVQNVGTVSALVISVVMHSKMVYLISLAALLFLVVLVYPLLRQPLSKTKERLDKEVAAENSS